MDSLFFKCSCCRQYIRMEKKVEGDFSDWAYHYGVEWSDYNESVPELSYENWERSERTPVVNEMRTLLVSVPFDEKIGNEFYVYFEPALIYFNGWDDTNENDTQKCAVIRCRLDKILKRNEYEAWIVVYIEDVISLGELYKHFVPTIVKKDIDIFDNVPEKIQHTMFENDKWSVKYWDAQGDCGEYKWIYTDDNGIRHLVMQSWFDFDHSIVYIGNIVTERTEVAAANEKR